MFVLAAGTAAALALLLWQATRAEALGLPAPTVTAPVTDLLEPKPAARALRDEIMLKIRDLESALLHYVEITGPPRTREPLTAPGGAARPY